MMRQCGAFPGAAETSHSFDSVVEGDLQLEVPLY